MLDLVIPTHHDALADARKWRVEPTTKQLEAAEAVLRGGVTAYPYAIALWDELALVLEKQGRDAEAWELVTDLERRLGSAGAETLCRLAKLHKKRAESHLAAGEWAEAERRLAESERLYGRAFEKAFGFYPRINQLTLRFVRASAAQAGGRGDTARNLLTHTRQDAAALLADPRVWVPRLSDDDVWLPAARGEAHALLGQWEDAEAAYGRAVRAAGGRAFYYDCMAGQLTHLLLPAFARLRLDVEGRLADPTAFFRPPPDTNP